MKTFKLCLQIFAVIALTATLFSVYSYYQYSAEWKSQHSPQPQPLTADFDLSKTTDYIGIQVPSNQQLKSLSGFSIRYVFEERDKPLDRTKVAQRIPYNGSFEIQIRDIHGKILKDELLSKMYYKGEYFLMVSRVDNVNPKLGYEVFARTVKGDSQLTGRHFVLTVYPIESTLGTTGMGGLLYFSLFCALCVFWLVLGGLFLVYKFANRKKGRA